MCRRMEGVLESVVFPVLEQGEKHSLFFPAQFKIDLEKTFWMKCLSLWWRWPFWACQIQIWNSVWLMQYSAALLTMSQLTKLTPTFTSFFIPASFLCMCMWEIKFCLPMTENAQDSLEHFIKSHLKQQVYSKSIWENIQNKNSSIQLKYCITRNIQQLLSTTKMKQTLYI